VSTHYLIDLFTDVINDVVTTTTYPPQTRVTGNYVVRVPDDVSVQDPVDLADLLTKKYQGILGSHGLFTQITYDALLDAANVNLPQSQGVFSGERGLIGLYPTDLVNPTPFLQTDAFSISWSGGGAGPAQAIVTYELFTYVDVDDADGSFQRYYQELSPDVHVTVEISFDNGVTFLSATDKSLVSIPISARGTQVILRFTRSTDVSSVARVFLGSWAVLY